MLKFLSFVWDCEAPAASQAAADLSRSLEGQGGWREVLRRPGIKVFSACPPAERNATHRLLGADAGLILGTLFKKHTDPCDDTPCRAAELTAAESDSILRDGPDRLIQHYWGWYVAFAVDPTRQLTWVLRSPMSDLPCYHARVRGVELFFSRVEDLVALRALPTSIDWPLIQLQVGFGQAALLGQSAIREIAVVERGEAVRIERAGLSRRTCWDPCEIARSTVTEDPAYAARLLRAAITSCIHAWAAQHEALLHRLSGGFDSSLVLHCLDTAPSKPAVTCLNYYWDDFIVDERVFARGIAARTRAKLVELRFGTENRLNVVAHVRRTAAPVLDVIDWQESGRERAIAQQAQATGIFMGSLGDTLFERDPALSPASDYLRARGFDLAFFSTLMNVAMHQRASIWKVLLFACREAWLSPPKGAWSAHQTMLRNGMFSQRNVLVSDEMMSALHSNSRARTHLWLSNVGDVPAAKLWQIAGLFADSFYDRHCVTDEDPPIVAAFFSQPLVELCLRIPSYLNVRAGVDRALAREAFAGELPELILRRSAKGSPGTWLRQMVERDAPFVREFLLEGMLVKERLIDRDRLEAALPGKISTRASQAGSILNLLYTEAWLRAWSGAASGHAGSEYGHGPG